MVLETFTYKPNPKKVAEDTRNKLFIAGMIVFLILVYVFLFRGLLSIILLGAVALSVIRLEISQIKKKGVSRFGSLVERFSLSTESLTVGDRTFPTSGIESLVVDADDFMGKPGEFFSTSLGTENYIDFKHGGTAYAFQIHLKREADLKLLQHIAKEIHAGVRQA